MATLAASNKGVFLLWAKSQATLGNILCTVPPYSHTTIHHLGYGLVLVVSSPLDPDPIKSKVEVAAPPDIRIRRNAVGKL